MTRDMTEAEKDELKNLEAQKTKLSKEQNHRLKDLRAFKTEFKGK